MVQNKIAAPSAKTPGNLQPVKNSQTTPPPSVPLSTPEEREKVPSLEDRLLRVNVLFDLHKKFDKLQESEKKLNEFVVANDREASRLEISDDENNEFSTTNPVVIAEVVKLLKSTIAERKNVVAAQIIW